MSTRLKMHWRPAVLPPDPGEYKMFLTGTEYVFAPVPKVSSPVQIGSADTWVKIAADYSGRYGIQSDGSLWDWGYNVYGNLGLGNRDDQSVPVQVGSETDWALVSSGYGVAGSFMMGLRGGALFGCGVNDYGQLALDDTDNRSSPVQVGAETDWSDVSVSIFGAAGIRNGALYVWGANQAGQLCQDTVTVPGVSSPIQVGAATDWSSVFGGGGGSGTFFGIRGGALYAWGDNGYGEIGDGTADPKSSPVQIGSETDWSSVAVLTGSVLAIRGGKLFAWGRNGNGQLGLGDTDNRSSPVQVGSGTDWSEVGGADRSAAAIRSRKLYTWGANDSGQLGLGDTDSRSSPVQVGSDAVWFNISSGSYSGALLMLRS